jgi:Domain of unknown function (DUF4157)
MLRLLAQRATVTRSEPGARSLPPKRQRHRGISAKFRPAARSHFKMPPLFPAPRLPIQAKLKVGAVNDPLEHEADRVADEVMRMPTPEVSVPAAPPQVSRKCAPCDEEEKLQKKTAGLQAAAGEAPGIVHEVLHSPGQPLDASTRSYFEPRFGHDFSRVRVHTGASAEQSARDVNAHAYTVGHNIVFEPVNLRQLRTVAVGCSRTNWRMSRSRTGADRLPRPR